MMSWVSSLNLKASTSVDSLDSQGTAESSVAGSPRSKLVATCRNCSYSFRIGSSDSLEFCSKGVCVYIYVVCEILCEAYHNRRIFHLLDCQTCFWIYTINPSVTPKSKKSDLKSNKQLIYEFQKEIDKKEELATRANSEDGTMAALDNPTTPRRWPIGVPLPSPKMSSPDKPQRNLRAFKQ